MRTAQEGDRGAPGARARRLEEDRLGGAGAERQAERVHGALGDAGGGRRGALRLPRAPGEWQFNRTFLARKLAHISARKLARSAI